MITRSLATVAGLSILLIPGTATASAYPVKGAPELTHNALYKTAKVPTAKCELTKGTKAPSSKVA